MTIKHVLNFFFCFLVLVFQGDKVRQLKAAKADKASIDAAVAVLLDLKKKLAVLDPCSQQQPAVSGKSKSKK